MVTSRNISQDVISAVFGDGRIQCYLSPNIVILSKIFNWVISCIVLDALFVDNNELRNLVGNPERKKKKKKKKKHEL
jgi:hypothetical protein